MIETLEIYDNNAAKFAAQYESVKPQPLINNLTNYFSDAKKLLEIGCGSGNVASSLAQAGLKITATDGSKAMLREASQYHKDDGLSFKHLLLPNIKTDEKYDGIYSVATLMHLKYDDVLESLRQIHSSLNESGRFYLSVSLDRADVDANGYDSKGRHFLVMTKEKWIDILVKLGFTVTDTIYNKDSLGRSKITWCDFLCVKRT